MAGIERALIDAHAFLWALFSPEKLSSRARNLILNSQTTLEMSVGTVWELLLKHHAGKLELTPREIQAGIDSLTVRVLPIRTDHLWMLAQVGVPVHRDPFDRLLIATALCEEIPVISADRSFKLHRRIKLIW